MEVAKAVVRIIFKHKLGKQQLNLLFSWIFTCIILSQIAPMRTYSKVGAYFSESSSRVGAFSRGEACSNEGG